MVFPILLTWMMDDVKPRRNSLSHNGAAITGGASKCPKGRPQQPQRSDRPNIANYYSGYNHTHSYSKLINPLILQLHFKAKNLSLFP